MLRDRDGVQHSKSFRTKREAVDYEAQGIAHLNAGSYVSPRASATTVEELARRWLASGSKRESSRERDRSIVNKHLVPALRPTRAIGTVTRADCQALVDGWVNAGLSPRTVVRTAASLRSMFQYGLDAELICRNPAARLKLPHIDTVERPRLTNDYLERLAAALGPQQDVFMWCGAVLGLRWAETAGLTLGAVDTARATVSVRSQIDRHGQITAPKTVASRRTLAAPALARRRPRRPPRPPRPTRRRRGRPRHADLRQPERGTLGLQQLAPTHLAARNDRNRAGRPALPRPSLPGSERPGGRRRRRAHRHAPPRAHHTHHDPRRLRQGGRRPRPRAADAVSARLGPRR